MGEAFNGLYFYQTFVYTENKLFGDCCKDLHACFVST
jgi:hypothetical protein